MDPTRLKLDAAFLNIKSNHEFANMSYKQQQNALAYVANSVLSKDPRYTALDQNKKVSTLEKITSSQRPVFSKPELDRYADPLFKEAEEGTISEAAVKAINANKGLISNALLPSIVARPAAAIVDALTGRSKEANNWTNLMNAATGEDGDKMSSYINAKLYEHGRDVAAGIKASPRYDKYGKEINPYRSMVAGAKSAETAGTIMGFVADFAVFHGTWDKISAGPVAALGKQFAANTKGGLATWAGKVALPALVSGTSSGAYGVFRENFLAIMNNDSDRLQDSFKKVAKTYGSYALLDYAINLTLGTVIPHLGTLKHIKRKGAFGGKEFSYKFTEVEKKALVQMAVSGDIPQELAGQLDPATYAYFMGTKAKLVALEKFDDAIRLRPYDDLILEANSAGMTVYPDPTTGVISVFTRNAKGDVLFREATDILDAKRQVSGELLKKYEGLKGEAKVKFFDEHKNMLQYSITEKTLDASMDPFKVKGVVDADTRKILNIKRAKKYVSPVDRPYIGPTEAEKYQKAFNKEGFAKVMNTTVSDEALSNIAQGKRTFDKVSPITISGEEEAASSVFVMLRNPANFEAVKAADELAAKAMATGSDLSQKALRNMYLMESGFDGIVFNPNKVVSFYPDKIKVVASQFDPYTGKIGEVTELSKVPTKMDIKSTVERKYKAYVGSNVAVQNQEILGRAAANFSGDLSGKDVQQFSRMVLNGKGINASKVSVKVSSKVDAIDSSKDLLAYAKINNSTGSVTIEIPKTISTPKAQKKFINELFEEFDNIAGTLSKGAIKPSNFKSIGRKATAQFKSPFKNVQATELWLKSGVEDIMKGKFSKTANGYLVKLPGKADITGKDLSDIADRIMLESMSKEYLQFDLARKGYKVTHNKGLYTVRGGNLDAPITGKSANEIAEKLNYRPDKISSKFAPQILSIKETGVEVTFSNGAAIGPRKGLQQLTAQFEDMDHMAKLHKIGSYDAGDVYIKPSGAYEVHMPEFGIIQDFDNLASANKFVRRTYKEFGTLQEIASRKGLDMWNDGAVVKISDGVETYSAKTRDDILKVFKDYPDSTATPELAAVDPDSLNAIDRVLQEFDMSKIPPQQATPLQTLAPIGSPAEGTVANLSARQEFRALTENMDWWTEKTMKELGLPDVLRKYRNLETTRRIAQLEVDKTDKAIIALFSDEQGKMLPLERRKAIFYWEGMQSIDEEMKAIELYGELTAKEKGIAGNLRELLGTTKDGKYVTGLAGKFGVSSDDFIHKYMPRIMDYAEQNRKAVSEMVTADELFKAALKNSYGEKVPKKLGAFFKNLRASDILTFKAVDDPIQAIQHYNRIGHRQLYMGRAWEEMYEVLKTSKVDAGIMHRFGRYRELLMGMGVTDGAKTASRIGSALGESLGLKNGENLMNAYFSVNYLSNMGFRPWLAVRNSTQVWTTLAPRFGNHWVDDAIKFVNELDETGYTYLRSIGLIRDAPPVVNDIMDVSSKLGRLTHRGLAMFTSSDDITRAVAYHTGTLRFSSALDKMKRGVVSNLDEFIKESGVNKLDDDTIREIRRLMQVGSEDSITAAKTKFGMKISDDTMFGYRTSQAPTAFTGSFWGKMFGQYGTYAAGYRANFLRGMGSGTTGDKIAFAARFLGNQAALYGAFKMLGINAKNFIPGAPALFGGGPQFEIGVALAESMAPDYRGQQARAKLMRKFSPVYYTKSGGFRPNYPEMMPGSLQLRYAQKSLEYLEQGDSWKAFLAATTTPVVPDDD